ncbi:MAG: Mrp/NBP35 family ATP-binding protein [Rikenellaceae bacterium]|nr:Mrp/NBP35 family ATP-binding protein [Rikenellaceae bacterium]
MQEQIKNILKGIIHPETRENIVDSGVVESVSQQGEGVVVTLCFAKAKDPFAQRIKSMVEQIVAAEIPAMEGKVTVVMKQKEPKAPQPKRESTTATVGKIIAVASGKGGVGKSTVTANLALTLRNMGYRVGVLDADIYGPSQPKMFDREEYLPDAEQVDGVDYIIPAESLDIELMSIGFFIKPTDALMWRGVMATSALKQLLHQTKWGGLDFLLIDLPPGTGDIHLTLLSEITLDGAVIVSTPQQVAVADVVRGVEMFRHEQVGVKVLGVVENMAWFTPKELPENKYYIFGRGGAERYAKEVGVPFLGEIPIIQGIMEGSDEGTPAVATDAMVERYYREVAERMIAEL